MSNSRHRPEIKRFKAEATCVRRILNEWDPIPGSPDDEYDCLVHHILSALHRGSNRLGLIQLIKSEMAVHFCGIEAPDADIEMVAGKISQWWESQSDKPRNGS